MSPPVIIVARSARQLAAAACAAGFDALTIDAFGDVDTLALSRRHALVRLRTDGSFPLVPIVATVAEFARRFPHAPVVWGSGFEAQTHALAALACRHRVAGCTARSVFAAKNPRRLLGACAASGIVHPVPAWLRAAADDGSLVKRRGSTGGVDVTPAHGRVVAGQREYFQSRIDGRRCSAAFVARAESVSMLGICEAVNVRPSATFPFRYAGAVALQDPAFDAEHVARMARSLSATFDLRGLCGIDFIVSDENEIVLLEVNPRPPATFDLLAPPGAAFLAHIEAGAGPAPCEPIATYADVRAVQVYYADTTTVVPHALHWPDWVSDRPPAGSVIAMHEPVCTITARGCDATTARAQLVARLASVRRAFAHGAFTGTP